MEFSIFQVFKFHNFKKLRLRKNSTDPIIFFTIKVLSF